MPISPQRPFDVNESSQFRHIHQPRHIAAKHPLQNFNNDKTAFFSYANRRRIPVRN